MMTTLSAVFGALPIALGWSADAEYSRTDTDASLRRSTPASARVPPKKSRAHSPALRLR
jgi:hypothetical protein